MSVLQPPSAPNTAPRRPRGRPVLLGVLGVAIACGLVAAYLRLIVVVTAKPVVPYQVDVATTAVVTAPTPTLTVIQRSLPRGAFDYPDSGSTVIGQTQVRGWAVDAGSDTGSGVDRVRLYLDGTYLQDAAYGQARQDIGAVFGPGFEDSGWVAQLDLSRQPFGNHVLEARAHSQFSDQDTSYGANVVLAARPSSPRGSIDAPTADKVVSGVVRVRGWALDEAAERGTGVDRVRVYLDGTLMTEADLGQSRPDLASAYGQRFAPTGWSADVDLSGVAPGEHRLEARVHSTVVDQETVYSTSINVGH